MRTRGLALAVAATAITAMGGMFWMNPAVMVASSDG
jgi:hypothetical protein